jgi:fructokinase
MRQVYGIGETVLDIIFKEGEPRAAKPGGSSLNTCVTLGRLGLNVEFISEYGNDSVGDIVDSFLRNNNVKTDYITRFSDGKSALALAFLDEQNNASYTFYKDFPPERLKNIPEKTNEDDIVAFCSIYAITKAVRPNLMKFIRTAKANGSVILYDPNFRTAHLHELEELRPFIVENLQIADMVRASDEDMQNIFGMTDPVSAYNCIKELCPVLVYTANKKGVTVLTPTGTYNYPVKRIKPVSTIGAGDNFNAGIIYSMIRDNINSQILKDLTQEQWGRVIETAVDFATEVCLGWDNYVSMEFAQDYVQHKKGD